MGKPQKKESPNGEDCMCMAHAEYECGCDADWTNNKRWNDCVDEYDTWILAELRKIRDSWKYRSNEKTILKDDIDQLISKIEGDHEG